MVKINKKKLAITLAFVAGLSVLGVADRYNDKRFSRPLTVAEYRERVNPKWDVCRWYEQVQEKTIDLVNFNVEMADSALNLAEKYKKQNKDHLAAEYLSSFETKKNYHERMTAEWEEAPSITLVPNSTKKVNCKSLDLDARIRDTKKMADRKFGALELKYLGLKD